MRKFSATAGRAMLHKPQAHAKLLGAAARHFSGGRGSQLPPKDRHLHDAGSAMSQQTAVELTRSIVVLKLCSIPLVVSNSLKLYDLASKRSSGSSTETKQARQVRIFLQSKAPSSSTTSLPRCLA